MPASICTFAQVFLDNCFGGTVLGDFKVQLKPGGQSSCPLCAPPSFHPCFSNLSNQVSSKNCFCGTVLQQLCYTSVLLSSDLSTTSGPLVMEATWSHSQHSTCTCCQTNKSDICQISAPFTFFTTRHILIADTMEGGRKKYGLSGKASK